MQIYCRILFDIINYIIFRWMMYGFMQLAMLQFKKELQKYIRMGITIFKIFIWGGISSDIPTEISNRISYDIPPQMKILNTVIP